ncbi:hypothetical protein BCR44DRAFT_1436553, partial [Catenaria anguillulae PL171]
MCPGRSTHGAKSAGAGENEARIASRAGQLDREVGRPHPLAGWWQMCEVGSTTKIDCRCKAWPTVTLGHSRVEVGGQRWIHGNQLVKCEQKQMESAGTREVYTASVNGSSMEFHQLQGTARSSPRCNAKCWFASHCSSTSRATSISSPLQRRESGPFGEN